ncbi:MAG: hypothetical protein PHV82_18885, partial [Victivallaceae bacterium]|nr:hypothetical protein [Victivallaceae bacterium]
DVVGSAAEFSRIAQVNKSLVSRYLSGKVKNISDDSWEKIRPLIIAYLDTGSIGIGCPLENMKNCPLQNEENMEILKFFSDPANKCKRYSVLLEIEKSKSST